MFDRSRRGLGVLLGLLFGVSCLASWVSCSGVPEPAERPAGSARAITGAPSDMPQVVGGTACNPVRFQDAALELVVREALGIPTGPIPAGSASALTELRADVLGIRSLAGVECLTGLSVLSLNDNAIADLSPVAGLVSLTALDLDNNQVDDVHPLARLTNLDELALDGNRIADVSPLGRLTRLEFLFLSDNRLHDVKPLRSLVHVRFLTVERNAIRDIGPLTRITDLGELSLSGNPISDLSPIAAMSGLFSLTLTSTPTAKLATLASSTLVNLDLSGNATHTLLDLPPNAFLPSLKWLALDHCGLSDADVAKLIPVLASRSIDTLVITDNQITDLAPFSATTYMNLLFNNNLVTDLSPILTFPSPPVLFVDVTGNPFDCASQAEVLANSGGIFINSGC